MSEFQSTSIWLTSSRAPSEKERSSPGVDCARASEGDAMDDSSSAHFSVLFSVLFSELCLRDEIFLGVPAGAAALGSRLGLKHVARVELDRPNMRGLPPFERAMSPLRAEGESPSTFLLAADSPSSSLIVCAPHMAPEDFILRMVTPAGEFPPSPSLTTDALLCIDRGSNISWKLPVRSLSPRVVVSHSCMPSSTSACINSLPQSRSTPPAAPFESAVFSSIDTAHES
mmetsp:Transcript_58613/g.160842  ORF Transcript_58613/g.160842 Transcript_58613/m.160842 type:complete len:228 (+) Transcript_58613:1759-2442(+)